MVNRSTRNAQIPRFQTARTRLPDLPQLPQTGATAAALESVAGLFTRVGEMADRRLDEAAALEGATEGALAGTKPGYDPALIEGRSTLRGKAFEQAATRQALSRLDLEVRQGLDNLVLEHGHDPVAFQAKTKAFRQGFLQGVPDELRPELDGLFGRLELGALSGVRRHAREVMAQSAQVSSLAQYDVRGQSLAKMAFESEDPLLTAAAVQTELEQTEALLLADGPKEAFEWKGEVIPADPGRGGILQPAQMMGILEGHATAAAEARILGPFSRLKTPAAMRAYRDGVMEEERAAGQKSPFDLNDLSRLESQMNTAINQRQAEQNKRSAQIRGDLNDLARLAQDFEIAPERVDQVVGAALASGDSELYDTARAVRHQINYAAEARSMGLVDLRDDIAARREKAGNQITLEEAALIQTGESVLRAMETGLKQDAISYAAKTGAAEIPPINLEDPLAPQLMARGNIADQVAAHYGVPVPILSAAEKAGLTDLLTQMDAPAKLAFITEVQDGLGPKAPRFFEEIAKEHETLAHFAGLSAGGDLDVVRRGLKGEVILAELPAFKAEPKNADVKTANHKVLGDAFTDAPRTQAVVEKAAAALYAEMARNAGHDPALGLETDLYERALNLAAGAQEVSGAMVGGIIEWNGQKIIAPGPVDDDGFERLMQNLTDDDLRLFGGIPLDANDAPVSADLIRDHGTLHSLPEQGLYRVELNGRPLKGNGPFGQYVLRLDEGALQGLARRASAVSAATAADRKAARHGKRDDRALGIAP